VYKAVPSQHCWTNRGMAHVQLGASNQTGAAAVDALQLAASMTACDIPRRCGAVERLLLLVLSCSYACFAGGKSMANASDESNAWLMPFSSTCSFTEPVIVSILSNPEILPTGGGRGQDCPSPPLAAWSAAQGGGRPDAGRAPPPFAPAAVVRGGLCK
jgi:hypothetical protein